LNELRISDDLALPLDAVTQTFGVLGNRGGGKTYSASVMAEEMLKAGVQVVVLDPIGAWWGLRSSADGESDGYPIVILGGEHADIPITDRMGERIAEIVVENHLSCVIDMGEWADSEQFRFVTAFAQTLYRMNRDPVHLFLEEVEVFCPQTPMKDQTRLLNAMKHILKRGRMRGIGATMISQRAAAVNKNVLNMLQTLIALRTIAPRDRTALKDWVEAKATSQQKSEFIESLSSLKTGEAWFWSPEWLDVFQRVHIRKRETFDSSATPKFGEQRREAMVATSVDLDWLRDALDVKDNPVETDAYFKAKITDLERKLADKDKPERVVERVEVPVITDEQERAFLESVDQVKQIAERLQEVTLSITASLMSCSAKRAAEEQVEQQRRKVETKMYGKPVTQSLVQDLQQHDDLAQRASAFAEQVEGDNRSLNKTETTVLTTIWRRYPMRLTEKQISVYSGYSTTSSSTPTALRGLRQKGLIVQQDDGCYVLTVDGFACFDGEPDAPQSSAEVIGMWMNVLPSAERTILQLLIEHYPRGLTVDKLVELTPYTATSSSIPSALRTLRKHDLAVSSNGAHFASQTLMQEG